MSKILTEIGTNEIELIIFNLTFKEEGEKENKYITVPFGINAAKVKCIVPVPAKLIIPPERHFFIDGVFVLRGKSIPLINLCNYFKFIPDRSEEVLKKWVVIIIEINNRQFGLLVHGVDKVYRISWTQIEAPPPFIAQYESVVSMTTINEKIIQLLDFEKIVSQIDPSLAMNVPSKNKGPSLKSEEKGLSPKAEAKGPSSKKDQQETILIAEDSKMIRDRMKKILSTTGYNVLAFSDGLSAWEALCNLKEKGPQVKKAVTCIITDIEMPRMDGHHLCKKIKEDPAFYGIPVLLFSSLINYALFQKGKKVGADDQITKPELGQLVERAQMCIEKYAKN